MSRSGLLQIPPSPQFISGLKEMEVVFSPENISSAHAITMRSILYFIVTAVQDGDAISPGDFLRICRDLDDPADLHDADDEEVLLQCVTRYLYTCGVPTAKLPQHSNRFLRLSQAVKPLELSPDPGVFLSRLRESNRCWDAVSNQFTVVCRAKRVNGEPPNAEVPDATRLHCSSVLRRLAVGFVADAAYDWLSAFGERMLALPRPIDASTSRSIEAPGVAPSSNHFATERLSTMQHEKYFNELKPKVNELSLHNTYVNSAPQEDITDLCAYTQAFFSLSSYMMDQVRNNAGSKWREMSTAAELRAFMIKCIHGAASSIAPFSTPTGLLNIRWADTTLSPLAAMEYLLLSLDEIDDLADSLRIFVVETSFYQGMEVNNHRSSLLREIKRAVADSPKLKAYPSLEAAKWSDYASVMRFEVRRVCFTDNRDVYSLEPSRDELLVLNPSAVMKRFKAPSSASSSKRHNRSEASGDARGDGRFDNRNENRTDHTKSSLGSNSHSHGGYYNTAKSNGTSSHQGNQPSSTKVDNQSTQQTVSTPSISSSPLHKPEIKHYSRNFSIQIAPHDHEYTNLTSTNTPRSIDKTQLPWRIDDPLHPLFNPVTTNFDQSIRLENAHPKPPNLDSSDLSTRLLQDNLVTLDTDDLINTQQYDSINLINTLTHDIAPDRSQLPEDKLGEGTLIQGLDFVSPEEENDLLSQRYVDNRRSLPRWVGEVAGESVVLAPDTQSTSSFISINKLEHLVKLCPDIKRLQATTHAISAHGEGIHPTVLIPIKYEGNTANVVTSVLPHLPEDIDILLGYSDILRFVGTIANSSDLLGKPYFPPDIEPNNITAVERWEDVEIPDYIHDLLTFNANLPPSSYVTFPNSELKLEFIDGGPNLVKSNHRHLPYDRASVASEIAKEWESYNWVDRISGRAESLCGVVLAPKPNGTFRLCIDTSELNLALRDVVTDIPEVADIVAGMANKKYFSQLDMTSAFMQLRLHPESIGKICFKIGNEVYRLLRVPFGVKTVPGHFQAVIEAMVRGIPNTLVYFDNIVIATETLEEHYETLEQILSTFNKYNVRLNVDKSEILYKKIKVLGVIVSCDGVAADPDKVADISSIPLPKTKGQLHSFLGRVNYLAQFIPHLSTIIKPLTAEIGRLSHSSPRTTIATTDAISKAFAEVKLAVTNSIQKVFPDKDDIPVVFTDASEHGFAGVIALYGKKGWRIWQTVAGTWTGSERNWATNKKELAAVHRTLMRFYHSLIGKRFILKSDHQALSHKLDMSHAPPIFSRWFEQISTLNFEVQYIRGEENVLADWLSRIQAPDDTHASEDTLENAQANGNLITDPPTEAADDSSMLFAMRSQLVTTPQSTTPSSSATESQTTSRPETTQPRLPGGDVINLPWFRKEGPNLQAILSQAQRFQPQIANEGTGQNEGHSAGSDQPLEVAPWLLGRVDTAALGKYYRLIPSGESGTPPHKEEFSLDLDAIPAANEFPSEECIAALLELVHIDTGHGGSKAMARRIQECKRQFPGFHARIEEFLASCPWCLRYKSPPRFELPPRANYADQPLDSIEIDIIDFSGFGCETRYGLVIVDINSGFTDIQPLISKSASHVCLALLAFMGRFGVPREIRSDQGKEFVNDVMLELTKVTRTQYNVSAPYYAQSHGRVERQNRTIRTIMNIFIQQMQPPPGERNWVHLIPFVLMCINRTTNEKTQMSPFQLMFARRGYPYFTLPVPASVDASNTLSWAEHLALVSGPLRKVINDRVSQHNEKIRAEAEEGSVLEPLRKGDVVFRLGRLYDSKDVPAFFGPYIVHEVDDRNNAYLRTPLGTLVKTAHPRNTLKKARKALANEIMVPEKIVADAMASDGSRAYCVQFVGYDSDANVWKSEAAVRNHPIFADYLRKKGFKVG